MAPRHSIVVTETDFELLNRLADHEPLAAELRNADLVEEHRVPRDVVTMRSRVRFEDTSTGETRDVTIVFPQDADVAEGRISVLAPIGTALLGLSAGQTIDWPFPDGSRRSLRVIEVLFQPEAEGLLAPEAPRGAEDLQVVVPEPQGERDPLVGAQRGELPRLRDRRVAVAAVELGLDEGEARGTVRGVRGEGPAVGVRRLLELPVRLEDLADRALHVGVVGVEECALLGLGDGVAPALGVGGEHGAPEGGEALAELVVDLGAPARGGERVREAPQA